MEDPRSVSVEFVAMGSDDGVIMLCQLERSSISQLDDDTRFISLEDIISRRSPPPPFPALGKSLNMAHRAYDDDDDDDMETPTVSGNSSRQYMNAERPLPPPPPQFTLHQPEFNSQHQGPEDASSAFTTPIQQQQQQYMASMDTAEFLGRAISPEDSMQRFNNHRAQGNHMRRFELAGRLNMADSYEEYEDGDESMITPVGRPGDAQPLSLPLDDDSSNSAYFTTPTRQGEEDTPAEVDPDFILNLNQEGDLERLTRKAVNDAKGAWKKEIMNKLRQEVDHLDQDQWLFSVK
ncbi:hypothetical protein GGI12_003020 [Dipsacomyces acuminosporus]|nr:hypothetical protein GGI12_003020 [Dipsacomyces acuminosporus]